MGYLTPLYDRTLKLAAHPKSEYILAGLSFAESSFFPVPPDALLMPMTLARPKRWWRLALLTTVASVLGGIFGYALGYFFIDEIMPWIVRFGYEDKWRDLKVLFDRWGWAIVFVSGFTPIPYKIFTIGSGALGFAFWPFVLASSVGRAARFFLVAAIARFVGARFADQLRRYIDYFALASVLVLIIWWFLHR